ncbi:MAG: DUF4404 family protein, partial [Steroidobacter sp.]
IEGMMDKELREHLASLHTELARTSAVSPQSRELLITLLGDITRLLGPSGNHVDEQRSATERLDDLAVQFEAEHPALGAAIRQVVDTLGKAGI